MKNKLILISLIIILFTYSVYPTLIKDKKALKQEIKEFAAKLQKFNSYLTDVKKHVTKVRNMIVRFKVAKYRGFLDNEIDDLFDSFNLSNIVEYFGNDYIDIENSNFILHDLIKLFSRDFNIDEKYPSFAPDYVNRAEKTKYYKDNTEYKEYIDENKKVLGDIIANYDKNLNQIGKIMTLTSARQKRIELFLKKLREYSEASDTPNGWWTRPMNVAKVDYLHAQIRYEKLIVIEQIRQIIMIKFNNDIKKKVYSMERKKRHLKLNKDNSKNIENALKMGEN